MPIIPTSDLYKTGNFGSFTATWIPDPDYNADGGAGGIGGSYTGAIAVFTPTTAPTATPGPTSAGSTPLPASSLEGQTWGWPIPITAGSRDIPGRILWRKIRKEGDLFYADVAVSYGWRAEIMAGFEPSVDFALGQHLANGVVVFEDGVSQAPGLTVTAYDGEQLTADPFLEGELGVGNTPAYIFHIYAVYQGLPLEKFGDRLPDAWNLRVSDGTVDVYDGTIQLKWDATYSAADSIVLSNDDATATVTSGPSGPYQSVISIDAIPPSSMWAVQIDSIVGNFYVGAMTGGGADWPQSDHPNGFAWKPNGQVRKGPTSTAQFTADTYTAGDTLIFARDALNNYYIGKSGSGWCTFIGEFPGSFGGYGGDPCNEIGSVEQNNAIMYAAFGSDEAGSAATLISPLEADIPACITPGSEAVDGITLKRCYEILGGLSRELSGRVDVANNITDVVDSLFLVESGSFNSFALNIGRFCDCDMRENNEGVEIVRVVDGTSYTVNLTLGESDLIRPQGQSGLTFNRIGEQNLPSEIVGQFIASEQTFRWAERPARRENGPKKTTTSTKRETIRVPLGMPLNQGQTYVSNALFRETEARDQVRYKLPWQHAIKVQAADVHVIPDGEDTLTVKVTRADRETNRIVSIVGQRLHTAQDYTGVADAGETPSGNPVAVAPKELTLGGVTSTAQVFVPTFEIGTSGAPDDFASLAAWYDFSDAATVTNSGGVITGAVTDKSGNGNNLTPTGSPSYANAAQNGLNVYSVTSGTRNLNRTTGNAISGFSNANGAFTFLVVARLRSNASDCIFDLSDSGSTSRTALLMAEGATLKFRAGGGGGDATSGSVDTTTWHVWTGTSTLTSRVLRKDGVAQTGSGTTQTLYSPIDRISIGVLTQGSYSALLDIGEIAFFDEAMSGANLALLESYAQSKWGI